MIDEIKEIKFDIIFIDPPYNKGLGIKAIERICLENDGKTLVIASHGGIIRTLQCFLTNTDIANFNTVPWTPNASISIVEYKKGVFTPKVFGITEHLNGLTTNLPNI